MLSASLFTSSIIFNLFSGLFGGGHGHAPQQPPQAEPANPSGQAAYPDAYRQFTNVGQFANMLGAGAPAVVLAGLTGGTALPALGLGGEIAGAAAVETPEALSAASESTTLFRAVSDAEFDSVITSGEFSPGINSYSTGKFFAETGEHAEQWGNALEGPNNFRILQAEFPSDTARHFMRFARLDAIGPARFATFEQLGRPLIRIWK